MRILQTAPGFLSLSFLHPYLISTRFGDTATESLVCENNCYIYNASTLFFKCWLGETSPYLLCTPVSSNGSRVPPEGSSACCAATTPFVKDILAKATLPKSLPYFILQQESGGMLLGSYPEGLVTKFGFCHCNSTPIEHHRPRSTAHSNYVLTILFRIFRDKFSWQRREC